MTEEIRIAVGIMASEDARPIMQRWRGPGIDKSTEIAAEIEAFIKAHGAREVVMSNGIIGCPHEEGIDFPEGQECPYCPFWRGKQGIQVR